MINALGEFHKLGDTFQYFSQILYISVQNRYVTEMFCVYSTKQYIEKKKNEFPCSFH